MSAAWASSVAVSACPPRSAVRISARARSPMSVAMPVMRGPSFMSPPAEFLVRPALLAGGLELLHVFRVVEVRGLLARGGLELVDGGGEVRAPVARLRRQLLHEKRAIRILLHPVQGPGADLALL